MKSSRFFAALLLGGLAVFGAIACSSSQEDASGSQTAQKQTGKDTEATQAVSSAPEQAPDQLGRHREESWMSCFINGTRIGYSHTVIEPVSEAAEDCLRMTNVQKLAIKRFQTETVIETRLTSLETLDGQVLSFNSELKAGGDPMATEGEWDDGQLVMRTTTRGKTETSRLAFGADIGGFFTDQLSLRRQPMKPRETRRLKALQPIVNQVGEIRLEAIGYEAADLPASTRQLLRIDMTVELGAAKLKSTLWSDNKGVVWKLRDQQIGMEAFLTSREDALSDSEGGDFDLGLSTVVSIAQPIENPHRTKRIVYRARLTDGDLRPLLSSGCSQQVKPLEDGRLEVTVWAVRPDSELPSGTPASPGPREQDLASTAMVQCDDPLVTQMAGAVAPETSDPWTLACALERHVKQSITLKNYSQAMATAAEVAKSREGDCTEHAMLLAALCRARQLPARVAIGLVYYPAARGFAYHMWSEVWIKDRWIPMDATLGRGGIGAAHLKFSHSSLEGSSAFADMLPVIQAVGRLELEIIDVKY
jgi:hypothetical protein